MVSKCRIIEHQGSLNRFPWVIALWPQPVKMVFPWLVLSDPRQSRWFLRVIALWSLPVKMVSPLIALSSQPFKMVSQMLVVFVPISQGDFLGLVHALVSPLLVFSVPTSQDGFPIVSALGPNQSRWFPHF